MLKLIGALLILGSATLIGYYFAQRLRNRTQQIRELQMCLRILETEICYGSTPLEEAFRRIGTSSPGSIGSLFERCTFYLKHLDGASTTECWQRALQELEANLALKQLEVEWLQHFGKTVGSSDREDQQKHIQFMLAQLKKVEKEALEEQVKHEKMYQSLGILAGLLLVILLM